MRRRGCAVSRALVRTGEQGIKAYGQQCSAERVRGRSGRNPDDGQLAPASSPSSLSITKAHGGLGLQVLGSVVHGSARPGSDLDLLSVPVDLMTRRGLRPELRPRIEEQARPLA